MRGQNQLLRSLSPTVFALLRPLLRPTELTARRVLFSSRDEVGHVYFPQSGAISLVTELRNGPMIECAMVGRDAIVGGGFALGGRSSSYTAVVHVPGQGHSVDIEIASRIAREQEEFRTAIIRCEQFVFAQAQQSAACNATHHLSERLARWLLRVRDVTGTNAFEVTQEFIAELLGVGRTSVSITAHHLQQAGLIKYRRGKIQITNLEGLCTAACECQRAITTCGERLFQSVLAGDQTLNQRAEA